MWSSSRVLLSVSCECTAGRDLLLRKYAERVGDVNLQQRLEVYVNARTKYSELLERYGVMGSNEVSTAKAAQMVGLRLPKTKNPNLDSGS
jgi:hypothetical protein